MNINNLLTVKSIVTLVLTAVFAYLSVVKIISGEQFLTVFTMIISFYFGVSKTKDYYEGNEGETRHNGNN